MKLAGGTKENGIVIGNNYDKYGSRNPIVKWKLPDIMKAKSKPIETLELSSLGIELDNQLKTTHYAPPPKRSKGIMLNDAAELVAALKQKGLL